MTALLRPANQVRVRQAERDPGACPLAGLPLSLPPPQTGGGSMCSFRSLPPLFHVEYQSFLAPSDFEEAK